MDLGPSDLSVVIFLLLCSFAVSVLVYFISKRKLLWAVFVMSVLSNLSIYLMSGSLEFAMRNLLWVVKFSIDYWPIINLVLLVMIITQVIWGYVKKD